MSQNFVVGGIIVAPIVVQLGMALVLTVLVSWLLLRVGFYRLVWHRPLVEVSIFCIFLGAFVVFTPDGLPLIPPDVRNDSSQPAKESVAR